MRRLPKQKDSPETRQLKREAAQAATAERASRKRWYITLFIKYGMAGSQRRRGDPYPTQVWPKLFKSEQEAWDYAGSMTGHRGKGIWTPPLPGARVVSYALSSTHIRPY